MATVIAEPMTESTAAGDGLLTAEEYFALPPDGRKTELVDGRIVEVCVPTKWHATVELNVASVLRDWCRATGFGRVGTGDGGVRTTRSPDSVRGADVHVLSYERVPKGQQLTRGYDDTPPELVVEIRSPDDSLTRMSDKADEYLDAGVDMVWLIDPLARTVRVLTRMGETPDPLRVGDTLKLDAVLPGFEAPVAAFFED